MDQTLADYIKRTTERLEKDKNPAPVADHNDYEVYPEQNGEEDRPINPYSRV